MVEKALERYLVKQSRKFGGLALKWVSPSMAGVPDRIVFLPGGRIIFVELKSPGKRLSPLQARMASVLTELGAEVRCIDSLEALDALFT